MQPQTEVGDSPHA
uniref:Uncharacterized protein n=1 Tax=Arundo donax TaxID=35708 RepID=A0A0A9DY87_ARUDO